MHPSEKWAHTALHPASSRDPESVHCTAAVQYPESTVRLHVQPFDIVTGGCCLQNSHLITTLMSYKKNRKIIVG